MPPKKWKQQLGKARLTLLKKRQAVKTKHEIEETVNSILIPQAETTSTNCFALPATADGVSTISNVGISDFPTSSATSQSSFNQFSFEDEAMEESDIYQATDETGSTIFVVNRHSDANLNSAHNQNQDMVKEDTANDIRISENVAVTPTTISQGSPFCNPRSTSFKKRRLFSLRSPVALKVMKVSKTYSKLKQPIVSQPDLPSKPTRTKLAKGRRLFTMDSINALINLTQNHYRVCGKPMLSINREIRNGLRTTLIISCACCKKELRIENDFGNKSLDVNEAAIWAGNASGSGFTTLKHSMTVMDIPFLSKNCYSAIEKKFSTKLNEEFDNLIRRNGEEERKIAIELNQIDSDGMPWTDVIGDGQWSSRSFNQRGKALSGSGVLIGTLTKKPLFVGVRNKVCIVCITQPEKIHDCFKNYVGSSSGMESSIIKEGFERSIEMHGLRYKRFVGDGDSSVYVNIKDVYLKDPNYFTSVQKITCKLHAIRAMNRNLLLAERNSNKNTGFPKELRDLLSERLHLFGKYANFIIQRHIETKPNTNSDALKADLKALPYHIFGVHDMCSDIICNEGILIAPLKYNKKNAAATSKIKLVPSRFFDNAIWTEIKDICERFANLSTSLIYDMNTNIAETFQSHVNKFCQGRRCNDIMRDGYNRKVHEATFSFMFGPTWYVDFFRIGNFDDQPLPLWIAQKDTEDKLKIRRSSKTAKRKRKGVKIGTSHIPPYFSKTRKPDGDIDYGPNAQTEDMEQNEVDFAIAQFLAIRQVDTLEEQCAIHRETVGQHSNPRYKEIRTGLITASVIGELLGLRNSTPNVGLIDKILHPSDISNVVAVKWGITNEVKARLLYEKINNVAVMQSGLFISRAFTGLAASPDGLIGDDGILEIKCPYLERYANPESVASRKTNGYLERTGNDTDGYTYALKKSSHYHSQVVQQLHVTERKWCDVTIWTQGPIITSDKTSESFPITPEGHLLSIRIFRDNATEKKFETIMDKSQQFFYMDLGPEIVNSRLERNMGYRQPDYRMNAINALKNKKSRKTETVK